MGVLIYRHFLERRLRKFTGGNIESDWRYLSSRQATLLTIMQACTAAEQCAQEDEERQLSVYAIVKAAPYMAKLLPFISKTRDYTATPKKTSLL